MLTAKQIKNFQKEILEWFDKNKRDLPWRHSRDAYAILISEVMLQQTQVSRVIPKFEAWMRKFPTIEHLADASVRDVLLLWSGLGYNRRALFLQKLAQEIVKNYKGKFPQDEKELQKLPGIGKYTSRALLCFAFNQQLAVVDTNIRKVILVHFKDVILSETKDIYSSPSAQNDKLIQEIANQLLPVGKAYEWNQALMDYSSAVLKKEKIAIPKQTKFQNSDRYYRGEILRLLLKHSISSVNKIEKHLQEIDKTIPKERLQKIIFSLQKDKLIQQKNKKIIVA